MHILLIGKPHDLANGYIKLVHIGAVVHDCHDFENV